MKNKKINIFYKITAIWLVIINMIIMPFGSMKVYAAENNDELHAVWISYLEFNDRLKDPSTGKLGYKRKV